MILQIKMLFKTFIVLFAFFIIVNALYIGIEQKSLIPVVKDLGSRFLLSSLEVQSWSLKVIENKGIYASTPNFWTGIWNFILSMLEIYSNLFMMFVWIYLLTMLYSILPGKLGQSGLLINIICAILTFLILQIAFLLIFVEGNKFELFMLPVMVFRDLWHAFPYIVKLPNAGFLEREFASNISIEELI